MTNILSLSEELLQLPRTVGDVDYDEINSQSVKSLDEKADLSNCFLDDNNIGYEGATLLEFRKICQV